MIQFVTSSLIGDVFVTKAGIEGIELHDFRSIYFKFCNVIRISYLNLNGEEEEEEEEEEENMAAFAECPQ